MMFRGIGVWGTRGELVGENVAEFPDKFVMELLCLITVNGWFGVYYVDVHLGARARARVGARARADLELGQIGIGVGVDLELGQIRKSEGVLRL